MQLSWAKRQTGFTIVELLIVIVVIGILATITVVSYSGIQDGAKRSALQSDLTNASRQLKIDQVNTGSYPATVAAADNGRGLKSSQGVSYRYSVNNTSTPKTFCLSAQAGSIFYSLTQDSSPAEGSCVNVALGAGATDVRLTDGNTSTSSYYGGPSGLASVTVTLDTVTDISQIKVWHYWSDSRKYHDTKTEVSQDGSSWVTVFDSSSAGEYFESSAGHSVSFSTQPVRYIRDWINGSTSNTSNHWVEIQAY